MGEKESHTAFKGWGIRMSFDFSVGTPEIRTKANFSTF